MEKKIFAKRAAIVLALTLLLTSFASTMPVNAAGKSDLKKANASWDLKNNKKVKFKTKWHTLGTKTHYVKMTKFKVKNAKKKGYKQCTFRLTFTRNINPTKKQKNKMVWFATTSGEYISPGGEFWCAAIDYKTGKTLAKGNKYKVKATYSKWKTSDWETVKSTDGLAFEYAKKASVDIKIVYPKKYKNLVIGAGGYSMAPHFESELKGGSYASWLVTPYDQDKSFFDGKKSFSDMKILWSKKDKRYAHFMRVK